MDYEFTKEFQLKYFRFSNCKPKRFYQSQWTETRWMFWLAKLLMLGYWIAVFFYSVTTPSGRWWIFLTNWGIVTHLLYFVGSFSLATYGMFWDKPTPQVHVADVTTVSEAIEDGKEKSAVNQTTKELGWFHIIVWMLQIVAFDIGIFVTVVYWAILFTPTTVIDYRNINAHALNAVIILLDLFIHNLPVRLLHLYHPVLYAVVYMIFTLILHGAGYESAIYNIIDWANSPITAVGVCIGIILVAAPLTQVLHFGFYHLRFFIARRTVLKDDLATASPTIIQFPTGNQNQAFVEDA